jgi:hypothetical protein
MTNLVQAWARFVMDISHQPELIVAGVQRIHRDVGWSLKPSVFFDESMTLKSTGYTQNKLSALQRNYYNPDSIARAKSDLAWRIKHKKYGSGAFDFRGTPKKGTKQDYCLQSCVISYYPQKKGTTIQVFWRTAELIKRFRGDLLFLRDFILPHFEEELKAAPPFAIDFRFANATFHPMFTVLLPQFAPQWQQHWDQIKKENPSLFRSMMYWCWRYLCDTSASIDSYSSARQVRVIANRVTDKMTLRSLKAYIEHEIKHNLADYPDSVQRFYRRKTT